MKWYADRLEALEGAEPIISVCGDDCSVCPRFLARSEEELHETAVFWHRAGWRDRVIGNDEIRCTGCGCRPVCSFMLLPCTRDHGVSACRDCPEFECEKVRDCFARSEVKKRQCEKACESPEEFRMLCRAFYEKERNMRGIGRITENMIRWAEARLGSSDYAGWCLSFIEDALERGNGIEIFGGDCAKTSAGLYGDALRGGAPERGAFVFYDCMCLSEDGPVNWGHCGIGLGEGRVIHAWDVVRIDDYRQIEALATPSGDHPGYIGWVPVERVLKQKP